MMKRIAVSSALLALAVSSNLAFGQDPYFPERRNWTIRDPGELGMNAVKLQEAVDFAIGKESKANKDLALNHELSNFAREPFGSPSRPHYGAGGAERSRRQERLHRGRVGRDPQGRHDLQRDEDFPFHDSGARL